MGGVGSLVPCKMIQNATDWLTVSTFRIALNLSLRNAKMQFCNKYLDLHPVSLIKLNAVILCSRVRDIILSLIEYLWEDNIPHQSILQDACSGPA